MVGAVQGDVANRKAIRCRSGVETSQPSTQSEIEKIIAAQIASYQEDIEREEQQMQRSRAKIAERRQKIFEWQERLAKAKEAEEQ